MTTRSSPSIAESIQSQAPVAELERATQVELSKARRRSPARILIADDEHLAALSLKQCLRELGYETIGPAYDGAHAVDLAWNYRPDLAVLDVRMADDFDGIDAARLLFEELHIPTVIVSAYSDARQVSEATVPGVFGYVVKPVTTDQLRPAIEVAWARVRDLLVKDDEVHRLRACVADQQIVERARRELALKQEIDEGAAMRQLRKLAREGRCSLADAARRALAQ